MGANIRVGRWARKWGDIELYALLAVMVMALVVMVFVVMALFVMALVVMALVVTVPAGYAVSL